MGGYYRVKRKVGIVLLRSKSLGLNGGERLILFLTRIPDYLCIHQVLFVLSCLFKLKQSLELEGIHRFHIYVRPCPYDSRTTCQKRPFHHFKILLKGRILSKGGKGRERRAPGKRRSSFSGKRREEERKKKGFFLGREERRELSKESL